MYSHCPECRTKLEPSQENLLLCLGCGGGFLTKQKISPQDGNYGYGYGNGDGND